MFGILNINKEAGRTSRDEVNVVQRLVRPVKVGHAGTLDPMATGVLLVCIGGATKLISLLQQAPKVYVAEFQFGRTSNTDDSTGEVVEVPDAPEIDEATFQDALPEFTGEISQVPPQFSAVKVDGQRAYTKARSGEAMELRAKTVRVDSIRVLLFNWPNVVVRIQCGSGTYIRSIARDLGEKLGCGGLMSALERTAIGQMKSREGIKTPSLDLEALDGSLLNPLVALPHLIHYPCDDQDVEALKTGRFIRFHPGRLIEQPDGPSLEEGLSQPICLVDSRGRHLLALAEYQESKGIVQPRNVFHPQLEVV